MSTRGGEIGVRTQTTTNGRVSAGPKASDIAKSARYEAKIAKLEQQTAALQAEAAATRAEYVAHQARTGAVLSAEQKLAAQRGAAQQATKTQQPPLVPVGRLLPGERLTIDPAAPPDPMFLIRVWGKDQLDRALEPYMVDMLKQTAARIEATHPGTKPANRGQKKALISYIVQYS